MQYIEYLEATYLCFLNVVLTKDATQISRLRQDWLALGHLRSRLPPGIVQHHRHGRHAGNLPAPDTPRHFTHHQAVHIVQAECAAGRGPWRRRRHHLQHDAAHPHAGPVQAPPEDVQGGARKVKDKPARAGGGGGAEVRRGRGADAQEG